MTFDQALQWAYDRRAILRFFESDDTKGERPTVRVVVVASNLEDRYSVVLPILPPQTVQDALAEAIADVKEQYEMHEIDAVAKDRRATFKAV